MFLLDEASIGFLHCSGLLLLDGHALDGDRLFAVLQPLFFDRIAEGHGGEQLCCRLSGIQYSLITKDIDRCLPAIGILFNDLTQLSPVIQVRREEEELCISFRIP